MFIYFWGNILAWNCILFPKKPLCWSLTCTKIRKVGRASAVGVQWQSAEGMCRFQLPLGLIPCSSGRDAALVPLSWGALQSPSYPAWSWKSKSLPHFPVVCAADHQLHAPAFSSLSFSDSALSWLVSLLVNCFLLPEARMEGNLTKISPRPLCPHSVYLNRCSYWKSVCFITPEKCWWLQKSCISYFSSGFILWEIPSQGIGSLKISSLGFFFSSLGTTAM